MWEELERLAERERLTSLLTTHYLEEADQLADRLAIVSRGTVVVEGTPQELKRRLHGDAVAIELADGRVEDAQAVIASLGGQHEAVVDGRTVVSRVRDGARAVPGLLSALEQQGIGVASVRVSNPSLDDVYLHYTGRDFHTEDQAAAPAQ
jgi:ABC-2 type transport system ATP-binding protein